MKNDSLLIVWIDDDLDHSPDADILQEKMMKFNENVKVGFYHPEAFRRKIEEKEDIDLFLVDDKLNRHRFEGERYRGKGISYIGLVRENYPDVPVYIFSAEPESKIYADLAYISEREADSKLTYDAIQDRGHVILYYDALDYKRIRNTISEGLDKLIDLLSPPNIEKEKIRDLLPDILKTSEFQGVRTEAVAGRSLDFATWVRKALMKKPGFLYDLLYSATAIGMTKEAFKQRIEKFEPALYTGIFSKTLVDRLWWKTSLFDIVVEKAKEKKENKEKLPSDIRKLSVYAFDLKENDIAECAVCKGKFPDTVGIRPQDGKKEPVHYRCSDENPEYTKMLFFDDLRIIKSEGADANE